MINWKCLYPNIFVVMYIFMFITSPVYSDNENGRVSRDPVKMARLVNFKVDLNTTLYALKDMTHNTTVVDALDSFLR